MAGSGSGLGAQLTRFSTAAQATTRSQPTANVSESVKAANSLHSCLLFHCGKCVTRPGAFLRLAGRRPEETCLVPADCRAASTITIIRKAIINQRARTPDQTHHTWSGTMGSYSHSTPILLHGFNFDIQREQRFNHVWAAAFLTPKYTDETNEVLQQSCYRLDLEKKREVKYGNNIAAFYYVLLHLAKKSGGKLQTGFWHAIARGLNTRRELVEETERTLTKARKIQRPKPARDVSETARAVDEWIDYMAASDFKDSYYIDPYKQSDIARDFLASLEGKLVNSAGVPLDSNIRPLGSTSFRQSAPLDARSSRPSRQSPKLPVAQATSSTRSTDAPILREPRPARKRSASPMAAELSPQVKKAHHDSIGHQITLGREPLQQPAASVPKEPGNQILAKDDSSSASHHQKSRVTHETLDPAQRPLDEGGAASYRTGGLTAKPPTSGGPTEESTAAKTPTSDVGKLGGEMKTMTSMMETMMDSMHAVADDLNALKEDIAVLKD